MSLPCYTWLLTHARTELFGMFVLYTIMVGILGETFTNLRAICPEILWARTILYMHFPVHFMLLNFVLVLPFIF